MTEFERLTSPEADALAAKVVADALAADQAAHAAARTPLPGPMREAFAPIKGIEVGPVTVRPLCDGDYDALAAIGTETALYVAGVLDGKDAKMDRLKRGMETWEVLQIVTTSPAGQVWDTLRQKGGREKLQALAQERFGSMTYIQLTEVFKALAQQLRAYWAPAMAYKPDSGDGKSEGEQGSHPSQG